MPLPIILIGSAWKKPTIPVMLLSSVVAMFNAVVIQHFSFTNVFNAIVNGFDTSMLPMDSNLGPAAQDITSLLNRGGMESMMTLLIALCILPFAGVLSAPGALNKIVESLLKIRKSTGSLIIVTLLTGILTNIHHLQRPGLPPAAKRAVETCLHPTRSASLQSRSKHRGFWHRIRADSALDNRWRLYGGHVGRALRSPICIGQPFAGPV